MVNTWEAVESMLNGWKMQGLSKHEIVVNLANACIGWNYIFGDRGEKCVPSHVKSRISSLSEKYPKEAESLKKRCQVALQKSSNCVGCKFFPNGVTLAYDCRGFTYWCFLYGADIKIEGAGATSQYNNNANWEEKGNIADMPKDKVCCTFRYDSSTQKYEHTLIYDGDGHYIHDSGEVKKCDISKYKATHYAIPKGLYGGDVPVYEKATVHADQGSTVRMRCAPNASSSVVAVVPIGAVVDVIEKGESWSNIIYSGKKGYMMNQFLIFGSVDPDDGKDDEYITVSRKELQQAYDILGGMLAGKG